MIGLRLAAFLATATVGGGGAYVLTGDAGPAAHRLHIPTIRAPHHTGPVPTGAGCATPVGRAVCRRSADPHVRSAMLLGALLEGGNLTGPWACGDDGWSCGPWQINRSVHHGVSRTEAADPGFAAAYMLPGYQAGCASVPAVRWRVDPRGSAAVCAYRAERPARMYTSSRVKAAWARLGGQA